jgi:peroxiredoxin
VFFFFAVWNKESVKQALEINKLISKYPYKKLNVVAISLDTSPDRLYSFLETKEINYPVVCDYKYWDSDYVQQFGIQKIPDILLLDRNHIINKRNIKPEELIQILTEWRKSDQF